MNFSSIPSDTLLGRILRFPLGLIPPETKMPVLQGRLRGKRWIVGSSTHGCWLGSYEYEKRVLFEKRVVDGSIVFDLGAQAGFYTLLASVLVGPKGKVFAFEPAPRNLLYLKEHLRLNRITNVAVIEAAVADFDGITSFDEGPDSSTGQISPKGKFQIRTVSLDQLISTQAIPVPNYMKIDVEGAEILVLYGARSMLVNFHPTLFLATHGRDKHQECCQFLISLGYELQAIHGNSPEQSNEILAYYNG